ELDAEVQPTDEQSGDRDHERNGRDRVPELATADEVVRDVAGVETMRQALTRLGLAVEGRGRHVRPSSWPRRAGERPRTWHRGPDRCGRRPARTLAFRCRRTSS